MPTKPVKLITIGPGYSETVGVICRFLPYRSKSSLFNCINSGVTGPNLTKILHNAEKFMPFNLFELELRYCNQFWNGSATMKIGPQECRFCNFKWLPWQHPLRDHKIIYHVNKPFHPSTNPEILLKIGQLDSEIPVSEINKKNIAKYTLCFKKTTLTCTQ